MIRKIGLTLFLSVLIFPFDLKLIGRKPLKLNLSKYYFITSGMRIKNYTVSMFSSSIIAIDAKGNILWTIRGEGGRIRIRGKHAFVRRGPFLFVYDLKTGQCKGIYRLNNELIDFLYNIYMTRFLGTPYFLVRKAFIEKTGVIKRIDIYRLKGNQLIKINSFPAGVEPNFVISSDNGIIILGLAPHNYFVRNGFADIYGGIYLLGHTGKIIASYRIYGKYINPYFLQKKENLIWVSYTEYFEKDRKKSGVILFDTLRWKPVREITFKESFADINLNFYLWRVKIHKKPYFPIILRNGTFILLDENLKIAARFKLLNIKKFYHYADVKHDVRLLINFITIKKNKVFILYTVIKIYNDPRHTGTIQYFLKEFKVLDLKGRLLLLKKFNPEKEPHVVPVVDYKKGVLSFIKGDKIETYKIID